MKFPPKELRLLSFRKGTSEKGHPYCMVKLADEKTFENATFSLNRDQSPDFLKEQAQYSVILEVDGKYSSVELVPLKQA